ncbi:MAG: DivIVA domain-containing protein [Butyribacter sp.]|nr:DivIVA domain-containing protein [bacterium]MDY3853516.1 DivIVA domain-containing protein [Butyribacter sp.]
MLTPIDIQNHTLKTGVRGYSKKETDDFLEEILASYEELYKENHELKEKITSLSDGIQYYKNMENTLQKALVLAEKTSTETQEAAKSTADAMINEAQAKADAIQKEAEAYAEIAKSNANRELEATRDHVRKLVQSYENYRLQFKKLAESQIEMLESETYSIFAPELQEILEDAPSADAAMEAEKTVGMNQKKPFAPDPVELTEEERLAATKDLSDVYPAVKEEEKAAENEMVSENVNEAESDIDSENVNEAESDTVSGDANETESANIVADDFSDDKSDNKTDESQEEQQEDWVDATPKTDGYVPEETKSVEPEEDSPFTFIDTE